MKKTNDTIKETKAVITRELGSVFGEVNLLCDGYVVSAHKAQISETKIGVRVFVDGVFCGKWILIENQDEEAKRFYPVHKSQLWSKKQAKAYGIKPSKNVYEIRREYFSTMNAFIAHIYKHNSDITVISEEQKEELLKEKEEASNAH